MNRRVIENLLYCVAGHNTRFYLRRMKHFFSMDINKNIFVPAYSTVRIVVSISALRNPAALANKLGY